MLTVVTITRNDLAGLKRTRASVEVQQGVEIEHVIVDAASTDGTSEYLRRLPAAVRWVSEPDRGRYDGMNKGVGMGAGDLVWFMNSGDSFASVSAARTGVEALAASGSAWAVGLSAITRGGSVVGIGSPLPFSLMALLTGRIVLPHQAALFTRRLFDDLGGYEVDFGLAADQLFMARCALAGPVALVPAVLCEFDRDGAGSSRGLLAHSRDLRRMQCVLSYPGGSRGTYGLMTLANFGISAQRRVLARLGA
ncbi:glycosyltransferase family 2 protein [Actinotalea sp. JY-7885]|uniref:glycosyltransferase family 2 protein n=1 Tax=Actinotalea sp. JY-7885 TaxID=2758576 RepID=UPI00165D3074|nr:glycosyltransferase family 2 protein [Actinotalea sp. JY-7885]